MSPELLLRKPYNAFQVDIWALGILLYIMLTLQIPFDFRDEEEAVKCMVIRNWKWPEEDEMKESPSEDLNALMRSMLEPEPCNRLTMAGLLTHRWIVTQCKQAQTMAIRNKR